MIELLHDALIAIVYVVAEGLSAQQIFELYWVGSVGNIREELLDVQVPCYRDQGIKHTNHEARTVTMSCATIGIVAVVQIVAALTLTGLPRLNKTVGAEGVSELWLG
jgi:hypothetical protein